MPPVPPAPEFLKLLKELGAKASAWPLFTAALTHRSWRNENPGLADEVPTCANERLEFLGDAVLGLAVVELLYTRWPDQDEGALSKAKALLVSTPLLARQARRLGLGAWLRLGRGEERSGGRERESLLADALEAVLGALFLSEGYTAVLRFVETGWETDLAHEGAAPGKTDYKSLLQETSQKVYGALPAYTVQHVLGPDHARAYEVSVMVGGREVGQGRGKSKKDAEQAAAAKALAHLQDTPDPAAVSGKRRRARTDRNT